MVDWGELVIDADGTFEEGSVRIMDSREQVLRGKTVRTVKVLWQHRGMEETHGNAKTPYIPIILSCLRMKIFFFFLSFDIKRRLHKHVIVFVCVLISGTIFFLGGKNVKPG